MKTVYKYDIGFGGRIDSYAWFKPLKVTMQGDSICLWAEVITTGAPETYNVVVVGTGHTVPDKAEYVDTFFGGPFVGHVYIERK